MSDPVGAEGVQEVDSTLRRETEQLMRRFPEVDQDEILRRMRETYALLDQNAAIKAHLVTITTGMVSNSLRAYHTEPPAARSSRGG